MLGDSLGINVTNLHSLALNAINTIFTGIMKLVDQILSNIDVFILFTISETTMLCIRCWIDGSL